MTENSNSKKLTIFDIQAAIEAAPMKTVAFAVSEIETLIDCYTMHTSVLGGADFTMTGTAQELIDFVERMHSEGKDE